MKHKRFVDVMQRPQNATIKHLSTEKVGGVEFVFKSRDRVSSMRVLMGPTNGGKRNFHNRMIHHFTCGWNEVEKE